MIHELRYLVCAISLGAVAALGMACQGPRVEPATTITAPPVAAPAPSDPALPCARRARLVAIDASAGMESRLADARRVATAFVNRMEPGDAAQICVFSDVALVDRSPWITDPREAVAAIDAVASTFPKKTRHKDLAELVAGVVRPAFAGMQLERHVLLLTDGDAATGRETTAAMLGQELSGNGISMTVVWLPHPMTEEYFAHAREFAVDLAEGPHGVFLPVDGAISPDEAAALAADADRQPASCPGH